MSFCTHCGSPIGEGANFCTKCGTRVVHFADAAAPSVSPVSQTSVPMRASYAGKDYTGECIKANYFRGLEGVGGKILFDAEGFTFHSHAFNIQTGDTRIFYRDILHVETKRTLGFVPNGMLVFTRDGKEHQFVLWNREDVIAFLRSRIS